MGASPALIGHLQLLLGEELGADEDELVMRQFRKAYSQPCGWRGPPGPGTSPVDS
ncbi:hypothetical protein [Streptomyces bluensis]|uniref:Uncharacterized protein n=1 Tax=Streptomyces bluensis TaxID=33897 RepID=A0ABW6UFJ1_9ACTN